MGLSSKVQGKSSINRTGNQQIRNITRSNLNFKFTLSQPYHDLPSNKTYERPWGEKEEVVNILNIFIINFVGVIIYVELHKNIQRLDKRHYKAI